MSLTQIQKAVFLDKDGTLIPDIPYNADPDLIKLKEGVGEALVTLRTSGYLLIVISNQAGIAHGYFKQDKMIGVLNKIQDLLSVYSVSLDGFYYCPHHPTGIIHEFSKVCDCRKPESGLLYTASEAHNIRLDQSWMIGDILNDVEAGNHAGCRSILINNGNETEWIMNEVRSPEYMATDMMDAVSYITKQNTETIGNHGKSLVRL